jgi:DNA (cytosine-5)-methyltransferase 1
MTKYKDWPDVSIDLLCGGTPCQSFSVAGLRKGLADPRGNLMLTFGAIAARYRPEWLVWENVPGVLSSEGGRDFGAFLGMLGELGYGFAYRVLDAQYFGLAQRRKRVFVVGCLGDWCSAAAVLFERHSLQGHPAPSRQAGQRVANSLVDRPDRGGGNSEGQRLIANPLPGHHPRADLDNDTYVPVPHAAISPAIKARDHKGASSDGDGDGAILVPMVAPPCLTQNYGKQPDNSDTSAGPMLVPIAVRTANTSANGHGVSEGVAHTLDQAQGQAIAFAHQGGGKQTSLGFDPAAGTVQTLGANQTPAIAGTQVRRLTPRECARLQGFPDDYLDITFRGKPAADSPKYKALGNSWAVPVVRWIGRRIDLVNELATEAELAA